ncbi:hypothetical protein GCM10027159_14590 [Lysobacter terrae]
MRIILLTAVLLGSSTPAAATCPWDSSFVSPSAKPLPPAAFRGIFSDIPVQEIIRRLGPEARDAGSGLYVLQWDVTDGRTFFVSTGSACGKPVSTGFHRAGPNNSFKPKPLRGSA